MTTSTYTVTGMTCGHCVASVTEEVSEVTGVETVDVDLDSGLLTVTGDADAAAVRAGRRRSRLPGRRTRLAIHLVRSSAMNAPTTLGVFGVALAVLFAGAVAVGHAIGPVGTPAAGTEPATARRTTRAQSRCPLGCRALPTVTPWCWSAPRCRPGQRTELAFRVFGPHGQPSPPTRRRTTATCT